VTALATDLCLDVTLAPAEADLCAVETGLAAYNTERRGPYRTVAIFLRDGEGRVRGGAIGRVLATDFGLAMLHVDADLRGQGHGRALLRAVEHLAVAEGCRRVLLDTSDFQAPDFYRRAGYDAIGRIDDYILGHGRTWFRKTLPEAA
jgi:GNAT superfamily N-acetyltransferase